MKIITTCLLLICLTFFSGFKNSSKSPQFFENTQTCFEEDEEEFVELMDGKIIKGKISKFNLYKKTVFKGKRTGSVVIDNATYEYEDVMAVQYKKNRYHKDPEGNFAKREYKGRINIFFSTDWRTANAPDTYYVQKGEQGPLVFMSLQTIKILVSDYGPALAAIEKYENQTEKERRKRGLLPTYESVFIYNKQ